MTNFKIHLTNGQIIEAEEVHATWRDGVTGTSWVYVKQTDGFEYYLNLRKVVSIEKVLSKAEEQSND